MKLAKPHLDVAVMTDTAEPMLAFWQQEVGLVFEEALPTGGGNMQHRHAMNGSVFKLNHSRNGLPDAPPTGLRELWIARPGLAEARSLVDPDGNRVRLVPSGEAGVTGVAVRVAGPDLPAQRAFYGEVLGLEGAGPDAFRCGDSLLLLEEDRRTPRDPGLAGRGYRYLTIQVFDCPAEHARILAQGGREGLPPRRLGDMVVFSMVRDPAGGWIEISQRASLTGPLPSPDSSPAG